MTIDEFIRALKDHHASLEFVCCAEGQLYQLGISLLREATLYETEKGDIVEPMEYDDQEDGKILSSREVLILDLDL